MLFKSILIQGVQFGKASLNGALIQKKKIIIINRKHKWTTHTYWLHILGHNVGKNIVV